MSLSLCVCVRFQALFMTSSVDCGGHNVCSAISIYALPTCPLFFVHCVVDLFDFVWLIFVFKSSGRDTTLGI